MKRPPDLNRDGLRWTFRHLRRSIWSSNVDLPLHQRFLAVCRGFAPSSARIYDLFGDAADEREFVSDRARAARARYIDGLFRHVLDNKLAFARLVSPLAPTPEPIAVVKEGKVHAADGRVLTVADLLGEHVGRGLVLRNVMGRLGRGLVIAEPGDERGPLVVNGRPATVESAVAEIERIAAGSTYLATGLEAQHPDLAAIFPGARNTLRLLTLVEPETGRAFVAQACQKLGTRASAPTDNGLSAPIDLESGLMGPGVSRSDEGEVGWHEIHPDTGAAIAGVAVPQWRRVREAMEGVATRLNYIPFIGWDVLVTPDGYTVIEGNADSGLQVFQLRGELLADERARRFFRHHRVIP